MLSLSKALASTQAQTYHKMEFTSGTQSYYRQKDIVEGEWQGQLAARLGLFGKVTPDDFNRLTEGQHPKTGQTLVKHRSAQTYRDAAGILTKPVEHRAGWDATFSAPKSVSLTALVGGDARVREAHGAAVTEALVELERYTQARLGGNKIAESTGKFIAAKFEHDTARPVDGYAAPQLHTHVFIMNVTERADGKTQALQERGLFETQNYATAVYQSALTYKLRELGYEIEAGKSGAPEIKGYSQQYLKASSPRSQQIKDHLAKTGFSGAAAAQIAAHATRDKKQALSPQEVLEAHRVLAVAFGDQPTTVVHEACVRAQNFPQRGDQITRAMEAVTYSRNSNFEREAVVDERALIRDALRRGMGETTFAQVRAELDARHGRGDFKELAGQKHATGRSFTTPETIANERSIVRQMMDGQRTMRPMMTVQEAVAQAAVRTFLNDTQRAVIREVLTSPDRVHGIQGLAGTGKTTVLASIREGAEASGYRVEAFAPTSRAVGQLRAEGMAATTLQSFLAQNTKRPTDAAIYLPPHLYMLDESSLASSRQMRALLEKIGREDRVLLIGDTAQHQAVDAGRPFELMQDAGMRTSQLDRIVRQRNSPDLLEVVKHLAAGETAEGISKLAAQGRITEIVDPNLRIAAIAKDYAASPLDTIIVSPDNRSRQLINEAVRADLQKAGMVGSEDLTFTLLVHRSDMTGADRTWAARYQAGDVLRFETGSKAYDIAKHSTATVLSVDARQNLITVERQDGKSVTYDPRRLKGVNVYREMQKPFATGERIQFTAKDRTLGVNNRDLGTLVELKRGRIAVRLDGKEDRVIRFDPTSMRHFDHGYAVTSHVSQGLTKDRVIAHIDTGSSRSLINSRLAYVSISRAAHDARIYTDNAANLGSRLARDVSKTSAVDFRRSTQGAGRPGREASAEAELYEYADSNRRLAAIANAYAATPMSTVVVARDPDERRELNRLIRAELQAQGRLAPDSQILSVETERELTDPNNAAQYCPGDLIRYRQGSPKLQGIASNSVAVVVSTKPELNQLTVRTSDGDEVSYKPHLTPAMTAQAQVYRVEQQQFAKGDLIRLTEADQRNGRRKGDHANIVAIKADGGIEVRFDTGRVVHLSQQQARHIEHGYAVASVGKGGPERVLISQEDRSYPAAELAFYTRSGRRVTVYTSPRTATANAEASALTLARRLKPSNAAPGRREGDMPAQSVVSEQAREIRHRHGRGL